MDFPKVPNPINIPKMAILIEYSGDPELPFALAIVDRDNCRNVFARIAVDVNCLKTIRQNLDDQIQLYERLIK